MSTSPQREKEVFWDALEISDVQQRRQFLDQACGGDKELRDAVDELLAAQEAAERFFTESADSLNVAADAAGSPAIDVGVSGKLFEEEGLGYTIGHYKLLDKIGEGGYGIVYLAEQEKPVRRRVALKIIKLGMDTKKVIARFEAERQALALMDHPNIARVFDAGSTEKGRPYFVMELVRGVKITEHCDERHLGLKQRLELFVQICQAVQHAHQKGIIHRDIKPSNVLVRMVNDAPSPAVIDFGIAKATGQQLTDETIFTSHGQLIGTPDYMSPEQVAGNAVDVDTRSDIYSLGALLYELLTGRTPFDTRELLKSGVDEMRRTLIDREPRTPSAKLTAMAPAEQTKAARLRHLEPSKLVSELRGDLDRIVMKALEKDRNRRYQTANDLATDVERYLNDEPILARPPSQWYRLQKLIRRNKAAFTAGTMVVMSLVCGLVVASWSWRQEYKERKQAVAAEHQAFLAEQQQERLRVEAEDQQRITQADFLISQNKMSEADHLESKVTALKPSIELSAVLRTLGDWHANNGRWSEAAARFESLINVDRLSASSVISEDQLKFAAASLESGNQRGYEQFRQAITARLSPTDMATDYRSFELALLQPPDTNTLQLLSLGAGAVKKRISTEQQVGPKLPNDAQWAEVLALLAYRQGHFSEANDWVYFCDSYPIQGGARLATTSLIEAMSAWRLASYQEAEVNWTKANGLIDAKSQEGLNIGSPCYPLLPGTSADLEGTWYDWVVAGFLMRECNDLFAQSDRTLDSALTSNDASKDASMDLARKLGEWHTMRGEWEQARHSLSLLPNGGFPRDYFLRAMIALEMGDEPGFFRIRDQAISRFNGTKDTTDADYILHLSLLQPLNETSAAALEPCARVLEREVAGVGPHNEATYTSAEYDLAFLGLFEYRRGNYARALECCQRSLTACAFVPMPAAADKIILALSFHKLEDDASARSELEGAKNLLQTGLNLDFDKWNWSEWLFVRLLLKEADGLIPQSPLPRSITTVKILANVTPTPHGSIGLGSWNSSVEYTNIVVASNGLALYQSDFVHQGSNGWNVSNGWWSVTNGMYQQTAQIAGCYSIYTNNASTSWANYTITLQAMKTGGNEGFLILFNLLDNYDWTWWNIGGWNNSLDGVEQMVDGNKTTYAQVPQYIASNTWYYIKIVVNGPYTQCYLGTNSVQVATNLVQVATNLVQNLSLPGSSSGLLAFSTYAQAAGHVVVAAASPYSSSMTTTFNLSGVNSIAPNGRPIQLTSLNSTDQNLRPIPTLPLWDRTLREPIRPPNTISLAYCSRRLRD